MKISKGAFNLLLTIAGGLMFAAVLVGSLGIVGPLTFAASMATSILMLMVLGRFSV